MISKRIAGWPGARVPTASTPITPGSSSRWPMAAPYSLPMKRRSAHWGSGPRTVSPRGWKSSMTCGSRD
ncbi:hypothetical protein G6F32_017556 [Rhizopus arrhizus]|nr:hypothetical protein G6F32_017556 [Rhizopus arrhizus]